MARVKTQYKCRSCGYISASYLGRCPNCGAWNQFEKETEEVQKRSTKATASRLIQKTGLNEPVKLDKIKAEKEERIVTKSEELNRVLGGGIELEVNEYSRLESVKEEIRARVDTQVDAYGGTYYTQSVEEVNPQIFAWLDLLDMNVWVILFLMTGVAGFTMISGLLIIILERTNMIGVLKALGADNFAIRKIFLSFSVFLIGRGMVWGNIIGVALCFIQSQFHLFKLDPATYYVDRVPIEFNIWIYLLLNVCTLLVSVLMLVGPSFLVTRIHPAKSIRFE